MAHDASELLGSQQLAGSTVNPRGFGWKEGAARVGVAGPAIGHAAAKRAKDNPSDTPAFPRIAFLAVTGQEVALIKIGQGGLNGKLEQVIARMPRAEITAATVSPGVLRTNLTINFTGGGDWEFEVSPLIRKQVVQVVRALGY